MHRNANQGISQVRVHYHPPFTYNTRYKSVSHLNGEIFYAKYFLFFGLCILLHYYSILIFLYVLHFYSDYSVRDSVLQNL